MISKLVKQGTKAFCDVFEAEIVRAQEEDAGKDKDSKILASYLMTSMSGLKTQVKAGTSANEVRTIIKVILSALN